MQHLYYAFAIIRRYYKNLIFLFHSFQAGEGRGGLHFVNSQLSEENQKSMLNYKSRHGYQVMVR